MTVLALDQQRVVAGYGDVVEEDRGIRGAPDAHPLLVYRERLSGAAAAALATRWWEGEADDNTEWTVDVPGGRVAVRALPDGHVELAGPAVLVADGTVTLPD